MTCQGGLAALHLALHRGVLSRKLLASKADVVDAGLQDGARRRPGAGAHPRGRADPRGLLAELWLAVFQVHRLLCMHLAAALAQALGPRPEEALFGGHLGARALEDQGLRVVGGHEVEVAAAPVLALGQLAHPDDGVEVLGPTVHGQVHDLGQAGGHGPQGQAALPRVDEPPPARPMEAHVHEALDEELGGQLPQHLLPVPSHLPLVHGPDDERVAPQERPAHAQGQERRLAHGRPARRPEAALDPDAVALHEPVVAAAVEAQQGRGLPVLRHAPVKGAHVGVPP
eukprot:CAMPEP_0171262214 /NCGR_PEP_ID=MMETSP0790-20130122/56428_1 /TAXON_ID=2925 /ORGANISM="Alexandrium catenella, Strain OF101" /LENGTH=284 /DNA_ID=CAMNT_0011730713 /DNA_START=463 /DNA_END=1314 /DNA_ORIENTATION=-